MGAPDRDEITTRMRAAYPPPADLAGSPRLRERAFAIPTRLPLERLWELVRDTSRLNRALGLGEMTFREIDGQLHGENRSLGRAQAWVEHPWSWVRERFLTSLRRYSKGWSVASFAAYELDASDEGSVLRVYLAVLPRGPIGGFLLGAGLRWLETRHREVLAAVEPRTTVLRLPAPPIEPLGPEASARLASATAALREQPLDPRVVDALVAFVREGDELDLDRIAPIERARLAGLDESEFILTCLHATRAGLLELHWDVVCPRCRGVRETVTQLGEVPLESRCEVCDVDFETGSRHAIEVTFRPHASIRPVERRFYCSAEPATKDHIEAQLELDPGDERAIPTRLRPGRHAIRFHGEDRSGTLDVLEPNAPGEAMVAIDRALDSDEPLRAPPSPTLRSATKAGRLVVERAGWSDSALRPERLLGMQGFRDLFAEQTLATGMRLEVGTQTVVFTDVVGSTAFYTTHGDPTAFGVVKAHFDQLYALVARHGGAVVKTIGDATMAVFADPLGAIATAEAIQTAFPPDESPTAIRLRVAMHTGPCIVVRFHQGLDYFGGTVNLAAKLQSLASAGEVAVSIATWDSPGVAAFVASRGGPVEEVAYDSDAFAGPRPAKRWTPPIVGT